MFHDPFRCQGKVNPCTAVIFFLGLLLPVAAIGEVQVVNAPWLAENFFLEMEKRVEKAPEKGAVEVTFAPRTVNFLFEPWELAQPRFGKVFKATFIPETLFFKTIGYDQRNGRLEIPCMICRIRMTKSGHRRSMPVIMVEIRVKDAQAREAIRLFQRRELRVLLEVSVSGLKWEFHPEGETFLLKFSRPRAGLLQLSKAWISGDAVVSYQQALSPRAVFETQDVGREFSEKKKPLQLLLKAAGFAGLKLYADWELDERGWYARDYLDTYGNNSTVAVLHKGREGAEMWTALPQQLPPGTYQVFLRPGYTRQRVREHIVKVSLNDASREFRWHQTRGIDSRGWIPAPFFETRREGGLIKIKALQVGGGGLGGVPEPPAWATLIHEVFITDDLRMRSPAEVLDVEK